LQEVDSALVAQGRLFVDYKPSALAQARDIITAIEAGLMTEADICAEIGDVYRGQAEGRRGADEITVYRSLGIAAQDLFCADHVWRPGIYDPGHSGEVMLRVSAELVLHGFDRGEL
jgi:ornithine cyclodeaminase